MASTQQAAEDNVVALDQPVTQTQLRSKTLLQRALYRLRHDYITLVAMAVLSLLTIGSFAAPLIVRLLDVNYNFNDLYNIKLPVGASASESHTTVQQWLVEDGQARRSFVGHTQPVIDMAFSPDGETIITASQDHSVRVWNVANSRNLRKLEYEDESTQYTAVAIRSDSNIFATASSDGIIASWETEKEDKRAEDVPLISINAHDSTVTSIDYSSDGSMLLSGGDGGFVRLWDMGDGTLVKEFELVSPVTGVAISSDGSRVIAGAENGRVVIWDSANADELVTIDVGVPVETVEISSDGTQILTASGTSAELWSMDSGEPIARFEHPAPVNSARFAQDDEQVLTAAENGTAYLWDVSSEEIVQEFDDFSYPLNDAIISPDGSMVLTGSDGQRRNFVLGTDTAGRDQLTRLLYAGQVSLKIGFLSAVGALSIGLVVGLVAGYFGGRIDDFIMWVITTMDSIPALYLLLIVSALLAPNDTSLILVLVLLVWTGSTRIVRGETFSLRERDYVMAARALGASNPRIMFLHIAPNVISILLIYLTRLIGGLILTESTLSFLGFGVKPPTPTWGNMLSNDLNLLRDAPHLVLGPGLMITITVLCLYIIGDGLRDAFDPTLAD